MPPLGVSWYYLEQWLSGKGLRDHRIDTVFKRAVTAELQERYSIAPGATETALAGLSDSDLSQLCGELDIGMHSRSESMAALTQPIATTAEVQRWIIQPQSFAGNGGHRSVVESLRATTVCETLWGTQIPATGPATVFVSHAWTYAFDDLLKAIEEWLCGVPLDDRASMYFWLDIFCVDAFDAGALDSAGWADTFSRMVQSIDETVAICIPVLAPVILKRSWCIFELFCSLTAGCTLSIATTPSETNALANLPGYPSAIETLQAIDSQSAQATFAADKARIDNAILEAGGFAQIDRAIRGRLLAELLSRVLERGSEHFDLVRALCDVGADLETEVGVYRSTALTTASNPRASLAERKRLRESGRLDDRRRQDAEVVRYLLGRGANVNAQSSRSGDTALISACRYNDRPTVLLLLKAAADPNLAQTGLTEGETAFLAAARWGAVDVLHDLVLAGADQNLAIWSSYLERVGTAAMWRGMFKSVDHLRILHERCGCDLGYVNAEGASAASLAAEAGCLDSLRYLIKTAGVPDPAGQLSTELDRLERDAAGPGRSAHGSAQQ